MTDEGFIIASSLTRICRLFEELDVTFPEFISVSCDFAGGVCFKNYGDPPEAVSFFGSRRALPEGLHKYLPAKHGGVKAVIVLNTTAEKGDFSSRWRKILKRAADSDPFTVGDPVESMLNDLVCDGFFSLDGSCFCSAGEDLGEAYDSMLLALRDVICKRKEPRVCLIRDLPDLPPEGLASAPASKSLIYRDRALRYGGHGYYKLKDDNFTLEKGDDR